MPSSPSLTDAKPATGEGSISDGAISGDVGGDRLREGGLGHTQSEEGGAFAVRLSAPTRIALLVLTLLLLALYQLGSYSLPPSYLSFQPLHWQQLQGCKSGGTPQGLVGGDLSYGTFEDQPTEGVIECRTAAFPLRSELAEVEYVSGYYETGSTRKARVAVQLILEDSDTAVGTARFPLPQVVELAPAWKRDADWQRFQFQVPPDLVGRSVYIQVSANDAVKKRSWFSLRPRLNFYQPISSTAQLKRISDFAQSKWLLLTTGFMLVLAVWSNAESFRSKSAQFFLFFLIGVLVHFRLDLYFYFDEWHVLERFSKLGFAGVIYTHNEHFLPLFFFLYYLEAKLFGDSYQLFLLVSLAIHAFNGVLVVALLRGLDRETLVNRRLCLLLGLFFVVNSLHAESLQWAFEQCLLLAQSVVLGVFLFARKYVVERKKAFLSVVLAGMAIAPLFFGNGYNIIFQLSAFLVLQLIFERLESTKEGAEDRVLVWRRALTAIACSAIAILIPVCLYLTHPDGSGHGANQAKPFDNLSAVIEYLFVGTQFGGMLRSFGLYPTLSPHTAWEYLVKIDSLFGNILQGHLAGFWGKIIFCAEALFAYAGLFLTLLILASPFLVLRNRSAKNEMERTTFFWCRRWLLGQSIVVSALVLPALGRWQNGVSQSLSMRYHYGAIVGVCILLTIVTLSFSEFRLKRLRLRGEFVLLVFFALMSASHLRIVQRFSYFKDQGITDRRYIEQLREWDRMLATKTDNSNGVFDGAGTELAGMEPIYPQTITPGRNSRHILSVIKWLANSSK